MTKQSYTVHILEAVPNREPNFNLKSITDPAEQVLITPENAKYTYVAQNQGRIININGVMANGVLKMTSSADYYDAYGLKAKAIKAEPTAIKAPQTINLTRLDDLNINPDLFQPMLTGTVVDKFVSQDGGFLPGSMIMAAGSPGVGKTTVLLELIVALHSAGKRALFISAEMNQIDMARYLKRFPNWGQLPILFLADYEDPKEVIEQTLNQGWDIVLTDSYTEVNDTVKEESNMSRGATEKWFLDLMSANNKGQNEKAIYTTFITILQMSKGGVFVGSNKLKHMTTAMMDIAFEGDRRYMEFTKNRLGQVGKKLYFEIGNGIKFDEARYTRDLFNDELVSEEKKRLAEEEDAFDKLFGFNTPEPEADAELATDLVVAQA
jgi:RecA/RadA recombinase